jgi:hypothetical protein
VSSAVLVIFNINFTKWAIIINAGNRILVHYIFPDTTPKSLTSGRQVISNVNLFLFYRHGMLISLAKVTPNKISAMQAQIEIIKDDLNNDLIVSFFPAQLADDLCKL